MLRINTISMFLINGKDNPKGRNFLMKSAVDFSFLDWKNSFFDNDLYAFSERLVDVWSRLRVDCGK